MRRFWPILVIFLLVVLIAATNYEPGTILSGWDNLHPEFNLPLNIKRSIFAVWQEYQGLGLLGGMAHASDLPRQLFLLALSLFLPMESLRYAWTFLMLFVGTVGAYYLIKYVITTHGWRAERDSRRAPATNEESEAVGRERSATGPVTLLGALFYLLNLATVQMFYAPFEAFSGFFGFLPWLLLTSLLYFQKRTRRNALLLAATLILATPAWYVQTFFVVFMMTLALLLLPHLLTNFTKPHIVKAAKLYGIILVINSFWLLPVVYFTLTNSQVNLNSKINQMATETIFLQNKEFGTLWDTALLKGFLFKGVDPSTKGEIEYMLLPWINHLRNPFAAGAGYLLFVVTFFGFIKSFRSSNVLIKGVSWLFIFSFVALAIDTPPFSFINSLFRNYVPLLNQIFRFPYTKFSTLASLVYAILFVVGIMELRKKLFSKRSKLVVLAVAVILMILFTLPIFRGHLFYDKERAKMPQEYNQLFAFFGKQDPETRIAHFPQHNFWGWTFYQWGQKGYGGSGFLWYGIKQPILDRNFNVWSAANENFYYEISHALYSKNRRLFEQVLAKYQVTWFVIDKNVFDVASNKTLFIPELEEMLTSLPRVKKAAVFGNLEVYNIELSDKPNRFVSLARNLPIINEYAWNDHDLAYINHGNYITTDNDPPIPNTFFYPFRSLLSLKLQKDKEFSMQEKRSTIELTTQIPPGAKGTLTIPSFTDHEKLIPVFIKTQKRDNTGPEIIAKVVLPEVILNGKIVNQKDGPTFIIPLPAVAAGQYPLTIDISGASYPSISNIDKEIGVAFFVPKTTNIITVSDANKTSLAEIVFSPEMLSGIPTGSKSVTLSPTDTTQSLTVSIPKIDATSQSFHPTLRDASKVTACDEFRSKSVAGSLTKHNTLEITASNATACTAFFAKDLPHDGAYALFVNAKHTSGQPLRFWVENIDQRYAPLDTYLPKNKENTVSSFILSPQEQFGSSYAFHFYNASIGRGKTVNEIKNIAAYPVFYNYLKSMRVVSGNPPFPEPLDASTMHVAHPNESLYIISNLPESVSNPPVTLVLSQSYNAGWKAYTMTDSNWPIANSIKYAFPFVFGREVKNHVKVNNWQNGWVLDSTINNQQIVLVYLPQYLQYLGFLFLVLSLIWLVPKPRKVDKKEEI